MPVVTVRNLTAETHRALRLRAAEHGRSTEAEIRIILDEAVKPAQRMKLGAELAKFAELLGNADIAGARDRSPIEPAIFE